jgi:hypothetical protein
MAGAEPVQVPISVGLQVKPGPQSEAALHGSCHGKAHILVVRVVHISFTGGAASQGRSEGQATADPPEHSMVVCA